MTRNLLFSSCVLMTVAACNPADVVTIPDKSSDALFWALDAGPGGVTVAVGTTYKLNPVARTAAGTVFSSPVPVIFSSIDSTKVAVDPDGTLRAKTLADGVQIIAKMTVSDVTKADTLYVSVTPEAKQIKTLKLAGQFGMPLDAAVGLYKSLPLGYTATDNNGDPVTGLFVNYVTTNTNVLSVFAVPGWASATGSRLGRVKLIAEAVGYGTVLADTADIVVQYPMSNTVSFNTDWLGGGYMFNVQAVPLGVGGSITFTSYTSAVGGTNVTFDDPTNVTGGNIDDLAAFMSYTRTFNVPGTYKFKDTVSGATGEIVVKPQPVF